MKMKRFLYPLLLVFAVLIITGCSTTKEGLLINEGIKYPYIATVDKMLTEYEKTKDKETLAKLYPLLEKTALSVKDGGLSKIDANGRWFLADEKQKDDTELLAHLNVMLVLQRAQQLTGDARWGDIYNEGRISLQKLFKLYDTDYCIRNSLKLKQKGIRFRLVNEYGEKINTEEIKKIFLRDPLSGKEYLAKLDGNNEFSCDLPNIIENKLRKEWLELHFFYTDNVKQKVSVQKESLIGEWQPLKDGYLLFTGKGKEREWIVPLRINDCGEKISSEIMVDCAKCLKLLAEKDKTLASFSNRATAYANMFLTSEEYSLVNPKKINLLAQTPQIPILSFDENGVLRYHGPAQAGTEYNIDGSWKHNSAIGEPAYSLPVINMQALYNLDDWNNFCKINDEMLGKAKEDYPDIKFLTVDNLAEVRKEPAYRWIEENADRKGGTAVWHYDMYNCYNDLEQQSGWISGYGQSVIIETLLEFPEKYRELIMEACLAYGKRVEDGGYADYSQNVGIWFEEVPNKSHILNADILTINTMAEANDGLQDKRISKLIEEGTASLRENLWRYDTGYWSKYDMNPKKEILFQLDFLGGEDSVKFDEIALLDPVSKQKTQVDIGTQGDFTGVFYISGNEWLMEETIDGRTVRSIASGYKKGNVRTNSQMEQNTYFRIVLPTLQITDYFDLPCYRLLITYKDTAKGSYRVKIQPINEGWKLDFIDVPDGFFKTQGDNKWKTKEMILRPQDMGWYMGKDYQLFHVELLKKLAERNDDWFFRQYAEKWQSYYE